MRLLQAITVAILGGSSAWALTADQVTAWTEDLDFVAGEFLEQELTLHGEKRDAFLAAVSAIQSDLETLSEPQVVVRLSQAIAIAANGHTRLNGMLDTGLATRAPLRAWWFKDGLYIVHAAEAHEALLGGRVVSIAGHPLDDVADAVMTLCYGNESWRRYQSLHYLFSPEILAGLGLLDAAGPFTVRVEGADGATVEADVTGVAATEGEDILKPWHHLSPTLDREGWVHVLDGHDVPRYLSRPHETFWTETLDDAGVMYLHYSRSGGPEEGIGKLRMRLPGEIEDEDIRAVVLDMRFNTGGNYTIMRPVFDKFLRIEKVRGPKGLYVITGQPTFSAGISNTTYMKEKANATIVGELVGDDLDFWAEGGGVTLPNSKLRIGTNDGFHGYSKRPMTDYEREHLHTDMNVDTLEPDLPAWPTFAEYAAGRDVCMEAVLANLD